MQLPASAHTSRPRRVHEIAADFAVEDVWALPTPGGPDDFPRLVSVATSLYLLDDELAAEIANQTMHGVLQLGWVPDDAGGWRGQMAGLVERNGLLGAAYMAAIAPFRHLLVYPPAIRELGRTWQARVATPV